MNNGKVDVNRGATPAIAQSGIGYIVIPTDENEREQYINDCFRTNSVTIQGGYGYSYISNVKILSSVLQEIKFPKKANERGSVIFWIRENFSNRPIIVGIIKDEYYTNLLKENQQRISQQTEDGLIVEIFEDANECLLNIITVGNSEHAANVKIKANSGSKDSIIRIETDGKVSVGANAVEATVREKAEIKVLDEQDEELTIITADTEKITYTDQHNNSITVDEDGIKIESENNINVDVDGDISVKSKGDVSVECDGDADINAKGDVKIDANSSDVKINANKVSIEGTNVDISTDIGFKLDNGTEPMVLGNQLVSVLNDLCTALMTLTVTCSAPGSPSSVPINAAQFGIIMGRLNNLLSVKSKLD